MITNDLKIKDCTWKRNQNNYSHDDNMYYLFVSESALITVLNRMTGFGHRDIETGWRDEKGKFWLASGDFDIREFPDLTVQEAINKIKENADTCVPRED